MKNAITQLEGSGKLSAGSTSHEFSHFFDFMVLKVLPFEMDKTEENV